MAAGDHPTLTLVFDVQVDKKLGVIRHLVPDLEISCTPDVTVREIYEHLEANLLLPNGHGFSLLLLAMCSEGFNPLHLNNDPHTGPLVIPLVCDQIWVTLVRTYVSPRLKVIVDRRRSFNLSASKCYTSNMLQKTELRYIDLDKYFPKRHTRNHLKQLCTKIFDNDLRIKGVMRRAIWMHLVGVYHPNLQTHEERETYVGKLRRVYDSLKGKWQVQRGERNAQFRHLCDSVKRDARRTDSSEEFYTEVKTDNPSEDDNIQKLVNIIVIYTLEHQGLSYTQGMTDLLSPILYVMRREEDAYICFAAMVERIKNNFSVWCDGTLNKIERLRHLCEVLDPQLYSYLTNNIQEDAFALFFGMVLIDCRREFSFRDSFHLLEVVWSAAMCLEETPDTDGVSHSAWAGYMTNESQDVVQQVFGETKSPYSAQPLTSTVSGTFSPGYSTRNVSLASYEDVETTLHAEIHERVFSSPEDILGGSFMDEPTQTPVFEARERSHTDPNDIRSPPNTESMLEKSPGKLSSRSESELNDKPTDPVTVKQQLPRNSTELSDMSSFSGSTSGNNMVHSYRSTDSQNALGSDSSQDVVEKKKASDQSFHTAQGTSSSEISPVQASKEKSSITVLPSGKGISQTACNGLPLASSGNPNPTSSHNDSTPASLEVRPMAPLESRLSPVAFFDAVEQLAATAAMQTEENRRHSQSSDIVPILSQLVSTERHTPHITRQSSLQVPIASSFPLFICLAILIQKRAEIMQRRLDFVGLSVLLNTQAGEQELTSTLKVARTLFRMYRSYQCIYFGEGPKTCSMWLDVDDHNREREQHSSDTQILQ